MSNPLTSITSSKISRAWDAFTSYRQSAHSYRSNRLCALAELADKKKTSLAGLATEEMGKTFRSAVAEVEKCALVCKHYADFGAKYLEQKEIQTEAKRSFVSYQPLGPVLAIMPWNFPFWQVFRFAAPALTAGNVCLLKHSSLVPKCAQAIEDLIIEAGFPKGVFQNLVVSSSEVSAIIADPRICAVTLTGSDLAGAEVGAACGRNLKKVVLELGGSDPFIVMPSCDLEQTVKSAVAARILCNGQSCIAAKRFIVHADIYETFEKKFVAAMSSLRVGDPFDPKTEIGPLAAENFADELDAQVKACIRAGAKLLIGGKKMLELGPGFYEPTVISEIPSGTPADNQEFFGPVALLYRVENLEQAIKIANSSPFGLGASLWSNNQEEINRCIRDLESGAVFVNSIVKSDPRLPFGGVKRSGFGRELGREGILEFVNQKTVWVG